MNIKKIITVLMLLIGSQLLFAQTLPDPVNVNGSDETYDGGFASSVTVKGNGKVTVNGDLTSSNVTINVGCMLIVNGDLLIQDFIGAELNVKGTLIVTGDLTVSSLYGNTVDIKSEGVLVVGGSYDEGSFGGSTETNKGEVYLGNPEDGDGFDGNGTEGDLGDLINADPPVLPDDILDDFIDEIDDPSVIPDITWEGSISGDWTDANNWTGGNTPNEYQRVVINKITNGYDAVITSAMGDVEIPSAITLSSGALIIEEGSAVTFNADVATNGQLTIKNNNTTPTSIIYNGSVTGDVTFEWAYDNLRWWFIGHPISNAQMSFYNDILTTQSGDNNYVLYDLVDSGDFEKISGTNYDFSAQNPIKGYLFKVKDDDTPLVMTGTVNTDAVYSKALQPEWQIIANPYPSYYQIPDESVSGTDFINTTGDVYVTVSTRNSDKVFHTYGTASGISSPEEFTGVIAPGQGFYVKTETPGDIYMRSVNCIHDADKVSLKSSVKTKDNLIRLKLKNESENEDEAVIAFRAGADEGYTKMDSEQRFNTNSLSYIYSIVDTSNAVINVLPLATEAYTQALGMEAKEGLHYLSIDGIESLTEDLQIFLEDTYESKMVELSAESTYEFSSGAGTFNDRFVLHFKTSEPQVPTDIDEEGANKNVSVYLLNDSELVINCMWQTDEKKVTIYSVSGAVIETDTFSGDVYTAKLNLEDGIYIINIEAEGYQYSQKVMLQ